VPVAASGAGKKQASPVGQGTPVAVRGKSYIEIYDNGNVYQQGDGTWQPNTRGDGVNLFGSNLTFEQMDIHDNGDDALEGAHISNITIRHSWLHETREDPTHQGLPFNQYAPCTNRQYEFRASGRLALQG
jgi:hypothetical protein